MSNSSLLDVRVARRHLVAEDICALELERASGEALPPFEAGAHIDVHVGGLVRQYSLLNHPSERSRYKIAVLRLADSRGGSIKVHERLTEGQSFQISAPRNHFQLRPSPFALLIAGGIGITPLMSMSSSLAAAGSQFALHYCARSRAKMAFAQELQGAAFSSSVSLHIDDEAATKFDCRAALTEAPEGAHLYVCGPGGFMKHVLDTARDAGWGDDRVHYEYFQPTAALSDDKDAAFEILAARTRKRVTVTAAETALSALARVGIVVPTSCEQGVCGTCLTDVLEGIPDHRDMFLTPEERARNNQFLPCCSRACSESLTLDL